MYIKYLLATLPQMVHNLFGACHLKVENHWSKRVFSVSLSRTSSLKNAKKESICWITFRGKWKRVCYEVFDNVSI